MKEVLSEILAIIWGSKPKKKRRKKATTKSDNVEKKEEVKPSKRDIWPFKEYKRSKK